MDTVEFYDIGKRSDASGTIRDVREILLQTVLIQSVRQLQ